MLLVHAATGVRYTNQCGGLMCDQAVAEGYVIPMRADVPAFKGVVATMYECADIADLADDALVALKSFIEEMSVFGPLGDEEWHHLTLDEGRISAVREAWVPVKITGHPGSDATLIWCNSD